MKYNNMRVVDLKTLTKECGLQGYSRLNKAELIAFIQNNLQCTRPPRPTRPPPPPLLAPPQVIATQAPSVKFRPDRPRQRQLNERQPNSQEVDILEQWEMLKNRPVITSKL